MAAASERGSGTGIVPVQNISNITTSRKGLTVTTNFQVAQATTWARVDFYKDGAKVREAWAWSQPTTKTWSVREGFLVPSTTYTLTITVPKVVSAGELTETLATPVTTLHRRVQIVVPEIQVLNDGDADDCGEPYARLKLVSPYPYTANPYPPGNPHPQEDGAGTDTCDGYQWQPALSITVDYFRSLTTTVEVYVSEPDGIDWLFKGTDHANGRLTLGLQPPEGLDSEHSFSRLEHMNIDPAQGEGEFDAVADIYYEVSYFG